MNAIHFCRTHSAWREKESIAESEQQFSSSETKRYLTLSNPRQTEFAISRLLLRAALSHRADFDLSSWPLEERLNNTPLVQNANWGGAISITHSKNYLACAISDEAVGIDIEEPREITQLTKMAARVFTLEQQDEVLTADDSNSQFLQLWTAKEALFKAHSSAGTPIQFMSSTPLAELGFHTTNLLNKRLFGSLASKHPFDQFAVYFWRSPHQVRQIFIRPSAL
ncbi:MAG: phosphopantetheinyl transferase [Saprospiraceae bacterium]|jgi:phosphopantetheinyl transferase